MVSVPSFPDDVTGWQDSENGSKTATQISRRSSVRRTSCFRVKYWGTLNSRRNYQRWPSTHWKKDNFGFIWGSALSDRVELEGRVKRKSALRPVLYHSYMNDLGNGLLNLCSKFANDMQLIGSWDIRLLQRHLGEVHKRSTALDLPLNLRKCRRLTRELERWPTLYFGPADNWAEVDQTAAVWDLEGD